MRQYKRKFSTAKDDTLEDFLAWYRDTVPEDFLAWYRRGSKHTRPHFNKKENAEPKKTESKHTRSHFNKKEFEP